MHSRPWPRRGHHRAPDCIRLVRLPPRFDQFRVLRVGKAHDYRFVRLSLVCLAQAYRRSWHDLAAGSLRYPASPGCILIRRIGAVTAIQTYIASRARYAHSLVSAKPASDETCAETPHSGMTKSTSSHRSGTRGKSNLPPIIPKRAGYVKWLRPRATCHFSGHLMPMPCHLLLLKQCDINALRLGLCAKHGA